MTVAHRWTMGVALVCLAVTATAFAGAQAGQPRSPNDVLPGLLAEVHGLRLAMEQSAAVTPRLQLTLARLTIEEQRVTHLAAQLNDVRQQLAGTDLALKRASEELADSEKRLQNEIDPAKRNAFESGLSYSELQIRQFTAQQQQLRTRENEAVPVLATEQNRWIDLNTRLDELERLLAPVR